MLEPRDIGWRYWLATVLLVTSGVADYYHGFVAAIGLTMVHLLHFLLREQRITSFPVQVRVGYLLLLLAALPSPMQWLFWAPMIGTWAQVLFGYCAMARFVSLMSWNRHSENADVLLRTAIIFCRPWKICCSTEPCCLHLSALSQSILGRCIQRLSKALFSSSRKALSFSVPISSP